MRRWWYRNWPDIACTFVMMMAFEVATDGDWNLLSWRGFGTWLIVMSSLGLHRLYVLRGRNTADAR
jgi:hypothetical protein